MRRLTILAVTLVSMFALLALPALAEDADTAAADPDQNSASYWEKQTEHPSTCYKHDWGKGSNSHGTADGKTVTLAEFQQNWPGDHWELLVVKGGEGNAVYKHPEAGKAYPAPDGKDVSHWIVCKGEYPDDTTTTTTTVPDTTTTTIPDTTTTTVPDTTTTTTPRELPQLIVVEVCDPEPTVITLTADTGDSIFVRVTINGVETEFAMNDGEVKKVPAADGDTYLVEWVFDDDKEWRIAAEGTMSCPGTDTTTTTEADTTTTTEGTTTTTKQPCDENHPDWDEDAEICELPVTGPGETLMVLGGIGALMAVLGSAFLFATRKTRQETV